MPSTNRAKPSPRKQENALDGFYGRSLTISAATSSSSTSIHATVENANRIGLNGNEGSRNVLTQEQIARCETNRLNALAIRERKMLQHSVTSTAVNEGSGSLTLEQIDRMNYNRSIALAIREQNRALQDIDANRIGNRYPSIVSTTYVAGDKRPFAAGNNVDESTTTSTSASMYSMHGEVEGDEDLDTVFLPQYSSLVSSSTLSHSSKIIEDDRKIAATSESALLNAAHGFHVLRPVRPYAMPGVMSKVQLRQLQQHYLLLEHKRRMLHVLILVMMIYFLAHLNQTKQWKSIRIQSPRRRHSRRRTIVSLWKMPTQL